MRKIKVLVLFLVASLGFSFAETALESGKAPEEVKAQYKKRLLSLSGSLKEMNSCLESAQTLEDVELCGLDSIVMLEDEFRKILNLQMKRVDPFEGGVPNPSPMGAFEESLLRDFEDRPDGVEISESTRALSPKEELERIEKEMHSPQTGEAGNAQ